MSQENTIAVQIKAEDLTKINDPLNSCRIL